MTGFSPQQSPEAVRRIPIEDLQDLDFPMLTSSVLEDEEDRFAVTALEALHHLSVSPEGRSIVERDNPPAFSPVIPEYEGMDVSYLRVPRQALYANADDGLWSPASVSSSSSSSGGSSFSNVSPDSSCEGAEDYLSCKSKSEFTDGNGEGSTDNEVTPSSSPSLASRRGRPMKIELPPRPISFGTSESTPLAPPAMDNTPAVPFKALHRALSTGILKDNFAGVSITRHTLASHDTSDIEAPLRLRPRRSNHFGFAF